MTSLYFDENGVIQPPINLDDIDMLQSQPPPSGPCIAIQVLAVDLPEGECASPRGPEGQKPVQLKTVFAAKLTDNGWQWLESQARYDERYRMVAHFSPITPNQWYYCYKDEWGKEGSK